MSTSPAPQAQAPATAHGTEASAADPPQTPQKPPAKGKAQPKPYGPSASVPARGLVAGGVKVYRQRKVGTLRLLPFYAKGSEARTRAEEMTKAVKSMGSRRLPRSQASRPSPLVAWWRTWR